MSTRSKSGKKSVAPATTRKPTAVAPAVDDHDVVIGVLGDDFSFGGHSLFRARLLYESLIHAGIAGKFLHDANSDACADVIVVPDDVFDKHHGVVSALTVGVSPSVFKRVLAANKHSKFLPLRHLFACWGPADQKKVASHILAHAPKANHWVKNTVDKFLAGLPPVCFSGNILLDGKTRSHKDIKAILQRIGIRAQDHCAFKDAVVLGDKGHGSKYMPNGQNITVLNLEQFMVMGSVHADQKFADYLMDQDEAKRAQTSAPVPKKVERAVTRSASAKRGGSRKAVRGRFEEDTEMVEAEGTFGEEETFGEDEAEETFGEDEAEETFGEDEAEETFGEEEAEETFGEDESGWDSIIF